LEQHTLAAGHIDENRIRLFILDGHDGEDQNSKKNTQKHGGNDCEVPAYLRRSENVTERSQVHGGSLIGKFD
jgi:hypothetical protein